MVSGEGEAKDAAGDLAEGAVAADGEEEAAAGSEVAGDPDAVAGALGHCGLPGMTGLLERVGELAEPARLVAGSGRSGVDDEADAAWGMAAGLDHLRG